jgi:hypothetical protein
MSVSLSEFDESDKRRIRKFLKIAEKLRDSEMFKSGFHKLSLHLRIDADAGVREEKLTAPDDSTVRTSLFEIRKLLANKSDTQFGGICNILYQKLKVQEQRDKLNQIRKRFNGRMKGLDATVKFQKPAGAQTRTAYYSPLEVIDLWFNAEYFHEDDDKSLVLEDMCLVTDAPAKLAFLQAIQDAAASFFTLADFIRQEVESTSEQC